jgi:hypothetical protein
MIQFQPILDEKEWSLVLKLLESQQHELPIELRHSDAPEYDNAMDDKRMMISDLIQRLRAQGLRPQ